MISFLGICLPENLPITFFEGYPICNLSLIFQFVVKDLKMDSILRDYK